METRGILKHLGIIRNELLIFATLSQFMTHGSGAYLDHSSSPFQNYAGVGLHLCGIGIVLIFGVFYVFAILNLPSSAQELKFEESTEEALKDHKKALPKRAKKVKTQT